MKLIFCTAITDHHADERRDVALTHDVDEDGDEEAARSLILRLGRLRVDALRGGGRQGGAGGGALVPGADLIFHHESLRRAQRAEETLQANAHPYFQFFLNFTFQIKNKLKKIKLI